LYEGGKYFDINQVLSKFLTGTAYNLSYKVAHVVKTEKPAQLRATFLQFPTHA